MSFRYSDSTWACVDSPYVCGGRGFARYDCPAIADVTELSDSALAGVLVTDLGECTGELTFPDDTTDYLRVTDTIPFQAFMNTMEVELIEGFFHPDGYWSFHSHGDLIWGAGEPGDFESLLGCAPIGDPIGIFYGGDPASSPPYHNPGMDSKVAGRTEYNSGKEVRCNGRKMQLLAWFVVYRPG